MVVVVVVNVDGDGNGDMDGDGNGAMDDRQNILVSIATTASRMAVAFVSGLGEDLAETSSEAAHSIASPRAIL